MLVWLILVGVFVLLWAAMWRSSPRAAYGAVWGFLAALIIYWFFSGQLTEYVTGMHAIPIWLPPIPILIVVIALFYFGVRTWINADNLPPPRGTDADEHHGDGHGHH